MLGTVMNALMLRGALTARGEPDVRVMTAVPMQSCAEPFIRLRADRHLRRGRIVLLAGGTGQPYLTADYAAVQRSLELSAHVAAVLRSRHRKIRAMRPEVLFAAGSGQPLFTGYER